MKNEEFVNANFEGFLTHVTSEAWRLPLINQKAKAFIAIAVDIVNQSYRDTDNSFATHLKIALQQGATYAEIEELLLFMSVYAGFNKVAGCFDAVKEIVEPIAKSPTVANFITKVEAVNQLRDNIVSLMSDKAFRLNGKQNYASNPDILVPKINTMQGKVMQERQPGKASELVTRLFARGEAFDSEGFIEFFTDKPVYQFGNYEPCFTKAAIKQSVDAFFSQVSALYHEIKMMWELGDVVFVEMDVIYWRKDGSVVTLPCSDIFRLEGDKFSELRIFMDANPVSNPAIKVSSISSVLTGSNGKRLIAPGTMKEYFYEHPEGKERVIKGFYPKWMAQDTKASSSSFSSNSSIDDYAGEQMSEQLKLLQKMTQYVLKEDWQQVKNFLADNIFYRFGSSEPIYGKQAVVDYFASLFKTAKIQREDILKIWEEPGIVTIEMDAQYVIHKNNRHVSIACSSVYRFSENKVNEWRVYVDLSPLYTDDTIPLITAGVPSISNNRKTTSLI